MQQAPFGHSLHVNVDVKRLRIEFFMFGGYCGQLTPKVWQDPPRDTAPQLHNKSSIEENTGNRYEVYDVI